MIDTDITRKGLLAVFLPGTGGLPAQFPSFLNRGAARGYHVIGLRYVNPTSVNVICRADRENSDCAGAVREEVLTGNDTSKLVNIAPADAIESRLTALLRYLATHRPNDGWGQFIDPSGQVAWSKVSINGNSQGAGHAAYIGKVRSVHRVGMYAGPSDWDFKTNRPASWYRIKSQTPSRSYFGYLHVPDRIANASGDPHQVLGVWRDPIAFAMRDPVVDVGSTPSPYGGAQMLTTTACTGRGTVVEHNCPMFKGNERVWDVVSFP